MIARYSSVRVLVLALVVVATMAAGVGCRRKEPAAPPIATPTVTLNHERAALGSPLEITYKFVVANGAVLDQDYYVMSHIVDADGQMMWDDDHTPPVPTSQWKPGQTLEYTRTVFVHVYPFVGDASIQVGLYSPTTQKRLPLSGEDAGQHAYKVARLQLLPQTENVFTIFKEGWHPGEVADRNSSVEWQWTKHEAVLAFKNPKKDAVFYLDLDSPDSIAHEPQQAKVALGDSIVAEFGIKPKDRLLKKIPLTAAQLGAAEMAELRITVDKTFVPALVTASNSRDPRELGVRVFHAFIDAR